MPSKKPETKVDDLLTDRIREVCKEHARDCIDTMFSFGVDEFNVDRSMRGLATELIKQNLVGRPDRPHLDKPTYAVGVSVLVTNKFGQLLLAKRKNNSGAGLLSTPGGRVEFYESVEEAAAREFKEETGATLGKFQFLGWKKHARFGNNYIMFYVHAKTWKGEIKNLIPDKSENWSWFDISPLSYRTCTEPSDILLKAMLLAIWPKAKKKRKLSAWVWCGDCDGCGWVEGGKVLKTTCKTCKGKGKVKR